MKHCMVIRTKNPHMVTLRVASPDRLTVAPRPVMNINNTVLATHHTLARNIWAASEKTGNRSRPSSVSCEFLSLLVARIPFTERLAAATFCLFCAFARAISLAPIKPIDSLKPSAADSTFPMRCGRNPVVLAEVSLPPMMRVLTFWPAESLIRFARQIPGTTLHAFAPTVLDQSAASGGIGHV